MRKKVLSLMMVMCILTAFVPCIHAEEIVSSGNCGALGDNVKWTLDSEGTLTISGKGDMKEYGTDGNSRVPWYNNRSDIKKVVIEDGVRCISNYAFSDSGLVSVTIPDSVTTIPYNAFSGCKSLTEVTIPAGVKTIVTAAFYECSNLISVTISDSVTSIAESAFANCSGLTNINVDENNQNYSSEDGNLFNKDKTVLIQYAIGKTDTQYIVPNSVTSIDYHAFYECSNLKSVTIPDGVTSIGDEVFKLCAGLTEITIPGSVTSIGEMAFEVCSGLKSVTISDGVTSIGNGAFANCRALTSVTIPDSMTSIGRRMFSWCNGLKSVTIPNSVTSIAERAFYNCKALTDVYYSGSETQWGNISIDSDNSYLTNATIHYNYREPLPITTAEITRTDSETDTKYTFEVDAENKYEDCDVYAAIYDADGILIEIKCVPLETEGKTSISVDKSENDAFAKIFIWADTLQPIISSAKEFSLI